MALDVERLGFGHLQYAVDLTPFNMTGDGDWSST